ncbi:MAG: MFS transporter [Pseudomonadota bacterium]|nr:MFS transporter [Pseudomonadota bacterium]
MTTATALRSSEVQAVGLVGAAHFLSHFYQLTLPPLFFAIQAALDVNFFQLGLVMTAYSVTTGVLQTPVGLYLHRIGARRLLIGGLALNAAAICAAGMASSFEILVVLMLLAGVGNSVFHPVDYALLSSSIDESRIGRAFSLHSFGGTAGFAASPLVIFTLADFWDWRMALMIVGAAGVALAIVIAIFGGVLHDNSGEEQAAAKAAGATKTGWRSLMTRPILVFFAFFALLAAAGSGLTTFSIVAMAEVYQVDVKEASSALTAFLIMSAAGVLMGGYLADKTQRHDLVLVLTYCISATCLIVVASQTLPFWLVTGVFATSGLMRGMVNPSRDVLVRAAAPPGQIGATFGFVTSGFTVGAATAPMLYGWLMDTGSAGSVFWVAAGFTLSAIVLVVTFRERSL